MMEQMTRAFTLNLTALSLLALIVGMFLIYKANCSEKSPCSPSSALH
jgi:hypothetical protein